MPLLLIAAFLIMVFFYVLITYWVQILIVIVCFSFCFVWWQEAKSRQAQAFIVKNDCKRNELLRQLAALDDK